MDPPRYHLLAKINCLIIHLNTLDDHSSCRYVDKHPVETSVCPIVEGQRNDTSMWLLLLSVGLWPLSVCRWCQPPTHAYTHTHKSTASQICIYRNILIVYIKTMRHIEMMKWVNHNLRLVRCSGRDTTRYLWRDNVYSCMPLNSNGSSECTSKHALDTKYPVTYTTEGQTAVYWWLLTGKMQLYLRSVDHWYDWFNLE